MIEFLETGRGLYKERLKQYMSLSKEVNILTGYISIEGLSEILRETNYLEKIRIIVGVRDYSFERLIWVMSGDEKRGEKTSQGEDLYDKVRRLYREGILEIVRADETGYRIVHSKGYMFHMIGEDVVSICGSNNLTKGGIEANKEWSISTDNIGVYTEMLRSFGVEWSLAVQEEKEVELGQYRATIIDIGVGESQRGVEYLEILLEMEDGYILRYKERKGQDGYREQLKETIKIISGGESNLFEEQVRCCLGEKVEVEVGSKGKVRGIRRD